MFSFQAFGLFAVPPTFSFRFRLLSPRFRFGNLEIPILDEAPVALQHGCRTIPWTWKDTNFWIPFEVNHHTNPNPNFLFCHVLLVSWFFKWIPFPHKKINMFNVHIIHVWQGKPRSFSRKTSPSFSPSFAPGLPGTSRSLETPPSFPFFHARRFSRIKSWQTAWVPWQEDEFFSTSGLLVCHGLNKKLAPEE